ncbi:MAG: hypothetical protein HYR63_15535 [Proteobacteria bacterium]|nr:hypothetical protein [Pseudomonadota bacterium]MBI3499705.1 hypothetical protein [Pseudomonadota bacterium]
MAAIVMLAACTQSVRPAETVAGGLEPKPPTGLAVASSRTESPPNEANAPAGRAIEHQPVRLVGLTPGEIERLLGHPRFVRHDGAAQIWRFANQSCVLDVFFYREADVYTVRHYELRAPGLNDALPRPCAGDVTVLLQANSG